jgi:hypothetical protein
VEDYLATGMDALFLGNLLVEKEPGSSPGA